MRLVTMAGRLLLGALALLVPAARASAAEIPRFLTNIAPPYQEMVGDNLDGTSMRAFDCVMDRLGQRYQVALSPWLRAHEQVRQGLAQGVFSVAPDAARDTDAGRLSLPLALERWVWVTTAPAGAIPAQVRTGLPVAAVLGSNQLKWLQAHEANVDGAARSGAQLLRMLVGGRVAAVLMDEAELASARREAGIDATGLTIAFERYMPLGVYFSAAFLKAYPGFLERFNAQVPHCAAANMALSSAERRTALAVAHKVRDQLLADPTVLPALAAAWQVNGSKPVQQIMMEDRRYQAHRDQTDDPLVAGLRDHPLSAALYRLRAASGGMVSEILLFDGAGMAVASDPLSSDLWQADERKFSMTVAKGPDTAFIDNIAFDQSTSQFSVQISFAVGGDPSAPSLGGLTIGLNIERTLNGK
ncbi:MAG: substrate-binding periplasmic protein [Niveispirillum sp.]|uniref:substrate-binding periplasmic protein n=1 Tax=Niveispirillum sp. TaxID=1917217 RepID=UPI0040356D6E